MSNHEKIFENYEKSKDTYLYEDWQDVVIKITRKNDEMECFAKLRKKKEYSIKWESNLVMEARMSGKLIDKETYENF